jgi:hypothetical protein
LSTKVRDQATLQLLAGEAARQAHQRAPEMNTWGLFAFDDGPVLAGGGTGGFLWFNSCEEMHEFISQHLPFWYVNPAAPDADRVAAELGRVLGQFAEQPLIAETARAQANYILSGSAQIAWWGRFGELASAETEFAGQVIRWFRAVSKAPNDGTPLADEEQRELAKIIKEYGA